MKKLFLTGVAVAGCLSIMTAKNEKPVIMNVNGEDIPSSEFRYLYNKNMSQQLEPQSFDEYLEMFKVYRLKVAAAKAAGKDTLESFKKEMAQYKRELAEPYLADSTLIYSFIDIAQGRDAEEVEASHIMLMKSRVPAENERNRQLLDSIRNLALAGEDFNDLAVRFSQDRTVQSNKGYLGYIASGRFPYSFETAAYETPEGQISEIVESGVGYHIVKPGAKRPSRGRVEASHIMKMVPQDASPEVESRIKQSIDSIYAIVRQNPDKFAEIATRDSDDKGSARQGGRLPEFGSGEMVPQFDAVAFSMETGEISEPFRTNYGWHIIKKTGHRKGRTSEEIKADILKKIANPQDVRYDQLQARKLRNMEKLHSASLDMASIDVLKNAAADGSESVLATIDASPSLSVASIDGKPLFVSEIRDIFVRLGEKAQGDVSEMIMPIINTFYKESLMKAEQDRLFDENEEYRNLITEYTDGSMLYEMSVERVWDKAPADTEGLVAFFENNRSKYSWDKPHAKGILVQALNDSVATVLKDAIAGMPPAEVPEYVKNNFAGKAVAERFVVVEGQNGMTDNLLFNGKPAKPKLKNFDTFFIVDGRIIESPEEMEDVKGNVIADYQEFLEQQWIKELKETIPVTVNDKEVNRLKKELAKK